MGGKVKAIVCDATKGADVASCVKQTVDAFGRVDILVNNVGIGGYRPFLDWTRADHDTDHSHERSRRISRKEVIPHAEAGAAATS